MYPKCWPVVLNTLLVLKVALGLDRELSCAVCRALVDEVNYSIAQVDPKKTIQVGSFRVDSRGNQGTYEKPYARSEVHLIEIFESICGKFGDYAETKNEAGQKSIGRTSSRDGRPLVLKDMKIGGDTIKLIKRKCESLVEDYEEEMVSMFRREDMPNIENVICAEITSQCSEKDLTIPMPVTEYAPQPVPTNDDEEVDDDDTDDGDDKEEDHSDDQVLEEYLKENDGFLPADKILETVPTEKKDEL